MEKVAEAKTESKAEAEKLLVATKKTAKPLAESKAKTEMVAEATADLPNTAKL